MRSLLTVAALALALVAPSAARAASRSCVTSFGETACGFDCKAAYGQVRCAQTPAGVCAAAFGELKCWDPAEVCRYTPQAQCTAAYGIIACGYDCKAAYGEVRCASTPDGVCTVGYGEVRCTE